MFESDQKNLGLSRALDGMAKMEGLQGAKAYKKAPYPWNPLL